MYISTSKKQHLFISLNENYPKTIENTRWLFNCLLLITAAKYAMNMQIVLDQCTSKQLQKWFLLQLHVRPSNNLGFFCHS